MYPSLYRRCLILPARPGARFLASFARNRNHGRLHLSLAPRHDCVLCWPSIRVCIRATNHAAPHRQIAVVVRADRHLCAASPGSHSSTSAFLLPAQVRPPVSPASQRDGRRIGSALDPWRRMLRSRLLPRRDHIAVGRSAVVVGASLRAERRKLRRGAGFQKSHLEPFRVAICARSSANLHRLNCLAT
jgi:hypothetical protein